MRRTPCCLSLLLVLLLPPGGSATAGEDYAAAEARYRSLLRRSSFFLRHRGRERLAQAGDVRAVAVLAKDYADPEEPKAYVRYALASVVTRHMVKDAALKAAYESWRARARQPTDAWLWYRTLCVDLDLQGDAALKTLEAAANGPLLRAAALRALASRKDARALEAAQRALEPLDAKGALRELLPEAAAAVLSALRESLKEAAYAPLATRVIGLLDEPSLKPRTRLVIARHLARVFGTDVLGLDAAPWRRELTVALAGAPQAPPEPSRYATPGPTFAGLGASGARIAYVMDTSDSMLTPLTAEEREQLKPGPVTTGPGESKPPGKPAAPEVDWEKVKNRFEAARELLKRSLRALDRERQFTVVLFGDKAERLKATPGMLSATPKAISAAIAELDRIRPGSAGGKADRPYGTLLGDTNLHGGLRLAFATVRGGDVKGSEYVDPDGLEEGCDTVFLLSDGAPTTDDWVALDTREPEDEAGDPETGAPGVQYSQMYYDGPFGGDDLVLILDEVQRLNLVRAAEIHCVAIGEANDDLLTSIAEIGLGRFKRLGASAAAEPQAPAPR